MTSQWNPTTSNTDVCIQLDDMLNDFAFGTLDAEATTYFTAHLEHCQDVADQVSDLDSSVDLLGMAVPQVAVTGALWQAIARDTTPGIALVAEQLAVTDAVPTPAKSSNVRLFQTPRWLAAVAAVLLIALTASTLTMGYTLRNQSEPSNNMESTMAQYMTSGGNAIQLSSHEIPGHEEWWGQGALLVAPDMPPVLILNDCEAMNKAKTYVVWLAQGNERTGMGQISVDDDGRGMMTITGVSSLNDYDLIGVSVKMDDGGFYDLMDGPPHTDI